MVFLANENNYLSTDLFVHVMNAFAKCWTKRQPSLDCFLISDYSSIPIKKDSEETAEVTCIYVHNTMPRSSHWFQVHDQNTLGSIIFFWLFYFFQFLFKISLPWKMLKEQLIYVSFSMNSTTYCKGIFLEKRLLKWDYIHFILTGSYNSVKIISPPFLSPKKGI